MIPLVRIRYKLDTRISDNLLKLLNAYLTPESIDPVTQSVAEEAMRLLAAATPQTWNPDSSNWARGELSRKWEIIPIGPGRRIVANPTKIRTKRGSIYLLDLIGEGTDGPITSSTPGKALYLPLTLRARQGWSKGLKYGEDYIMVKSVKGITPDASTRPVPTMLPRIQRLYNSSVMKYITEKTGIKFK